MSSLIIHLMLNNDDCTVALKAQCTAKKTHASRQNITNFTAHAWGSRTAYRNTPPISEIRTMMDYVYMWWVSGMGTLTGMRYTLTGVGQSHQCGTITQISSLAFYSLTGLMSGTSISMKTDNYGCFFVYLWLTVGVEMRLLHEPVPRWLTFREQDQTYEQVCESDENKYFWLKQSFRPESKQILRHVVHGLWLLLLLLIGLISHSR